MSDVDQLFKTFPGTTLVRAPLSIALRSVDQTSQSESIAAEGFLGAFYRGDFIYCVHDSFQCQRQEPLTIDSIAYHLPSFEILRAVKTDANLHLLIKGDDWWAAMRLNQSYVDVEFGTDSLAEGQRLARRFHDGLAVRTVPDKAVSFQVWTEEGYPSFRKFADVSWESIQMNYPGATRRNLDALAQFTRTRDSSDGRIILFHGPPGTGKTWAIRALLTSWKQWAQGAVVMDPENLLGTPSYLLNIMEQIHKDSTRVLIIEDADEVVERHGTRGSGLSRLLNVTDGMIGADSDIMVLLSTNSRPSTLDPALLRPGRCLAEVGFDRFSIDEASERLGAHGPAKSPMTLAEIFRGIGETSQLSSEKPIMTGQYL